MSELQGMLELFFLENDSVKEYYGMRYNMNVMADMAGDPKAFERSAFLAVKYFADLHTNKHIFHGDIKPANIFIGIEGSSFMMTDSGTILLYDNQCDDDDDDIYTLKYAGTPKYSSDEHKYAYWNKVSRSKNDLLREDKHQLMATLEEMIQQSDRVPPSLRIIIASL